MKKYCKLASMALLLFLSIIAGVFALSACSTAPKPRDLDIATIKGEIPVYLVSVMLTKKADTDGMGKAYVQKLCSEQMNNVKNVLRTEEGININLDTFNKEYANYSDIQSDEVNVTGSYNLNRHYWISTKKEPLRIELNLMLATVGKESMPLTYTIYKDDPDYIPGYKAQKTVWIKFVPKN